MDRFPQFAIIGAAKSASTWLHLTLRQHPSIFMPENETPFFEDPYYDEAKLGQLAAELNPAPADAVIGIKCPNYLCTPECAPRLAKHLPQARLLAILRNPVDRAISQYYHLIRSGRLQMAPPDVAFSRYLAGKFDPPFARRQIMEFGLYAAGLANFQQFFPVAQLLVLTDLDMRNSSIDVFQRACRFIGVADDFAPANIAMPRNQGVYFSPFLSFIQALNRRGQTFDERTGWEKPREDLIARAARRLAVLGSRVSAATRLFVRNQEPTVSARTRASLLEFYLPDIIRLESMLQIDLSPWKSPAQS